MSDERALLASIWEHPHEDTPRLVYADWLDEHDNAPRAEFIRVQCELARLDEWDDAERVAELRAREARLWKPNAKAWKADLPRTLQQRAAFRRGFVYPRGVAFGGAAFLKLKPDAFDAAPQWNVTLRSFVRQFDSVFASPLLLRANELSVQADSVPRDVYAELANNDRLRHVTHLFLSTERTEPESLRVFYSGAATASVNYLSTGQLNAGAFAALADSTTAARLRALAFSHSEAADRDGWGRCHLGAARFSNLRAVRFRYLTQGSAGASVVSLLTAAPTAQLRRIEMNFCRVTDEGAEQFAAWPGLAEVRHLELIYNRFGERGFRALLTSPFVANLKYLLLSGRDLRDLPAVRADLDARFAGVVHYK